VIEPSGTSPARESCDQTRIRTVFGLHSQAENGLAETTIMAGKRVILELGSGNDLHGGDYTKAALRAVQDALHHSSLSMLRSLGVDAGTEMFVEVTIGVQRPEQVDTEAVKVSLPHGVVTVKAVKGGLDVIDHERGDNAVIAAAAVAVRLDLG
jgi:uncharacterized protein (TIGR02058 family)